MAEKRVSWLRNLDTKAVEQWMQGKPDLLIAQIMAGDLNEAERELVVSIIRGDPPKRRRGAKISSLKPVAAGLVRFWLRDVDGWESDDGILRAIEQKCEVSRTMAQKYLRYLDNPTTAAQDKQSKLFDDMVRDYRCLLRSTDPENIELMRQAREKDLKPISEK